LNKETMNISYQIKLHQNNIIDAERFLF